MNGKSSKVYLFYCSTSIDPMELERVYGEQGNELKFIPLPCSGKIDILYMTKAFETGADGVAVVTCQQGECRYLEGNLRARKRADSVGALLEEIGMGKGRMAIIEKNEGGIQQIIRKVEDFRVRIKALPGQAPNASISAPVS